MDNAGPDGAILKISLAVVILQRRKVMRCVQFYWTRGCFSKTEPCFQKKHSIWPSSGLKTVDLDYCSSLSVARLVRFWFKSLPPTTDSSYKVIYSFWLCVRTRCLSIYAPSFAAVVWCKWPLRVIAFWARNTPQTVSRNLNCILKWVKVGATPPKPRTYCARLVASC